MKYSSCVPCCSSNYEKKCNCNTCKGKSSIALVTSVTKLMQGFLHHCLSCLYISLSYFLSQRAAAGDIFSCEHSCLCSVYLVLQFQWQYVKQCFLKILFREHFNKALKLSDLWDTVFCQSTLSNLTMVIMTK